MAGCFTLWAGYSRVFLACDIPEAAAMVLTHWAQASQGLVNV